MSALEQRAGLRASARLADHLQRVLVDLVALHLNGKQAHWTVVGHNFRDLHLQLDEIVELARESADTIAERMRALDTVPDARPASVASTTGLPELRLSELSTRDTVDAMTTQLREVSATVREVHDEVDDEDPATADLLHRIIEGVEKQAWMLRSENRTA